MQRVRIGLTGLACVFLLVLLAAAFFGLANHEQTSRPAGRRPRRRPRRQRHGREPRASRSPNSASRPASAATKRAGNAAAPAVRSDAR